jgi:hypothetical protein
MLEESLATLTFFKSEQSTLLKAFMKQIPICLFKFKDYFLDLRVRLIKIIGL